MDLDDGCAAGALQLRIAQVAHDEHSVQLARIVICGEVPELRVRRLLLLVGRPSALSGDWIVVVDW